MQGARNSCYTEPRKFDPYPTLALLIRMFDFILEIFLQIIAYGTGRLIIPVLSLGTMRGEAFKGESAPDNKSSFWRDSKGIVIGADMTIVIGIVFWVIAAIATAIYVNR
ncbi:hypothetical protein ACO0LC_10995 [Undibacterium sp. JH2W]|uniref:hypothetical protein n=1 Tax=Undibacterium sp. JH2W TaxID=3413037 RepID=UPI003BEF8EDD